MGSSHSASGGNFGGAGQVIFRNGFGGINLIVMEVWRDSSQATLGPISHSTLSQKQEKCIGVPAVNAQLSRPALVLSLLTIPPKDMPELLEKTQKIILCYQFFHSWSQSSGVCLEEEREGRIFILPLPELLCFRLSILEFSLRFPLGKRRAFCPLTKCLKYYSSNPFSFYK